MCWCKVFEANAGYKREFSLTNVDGEVFEEELSWGVESQIHVQPQHVADATLMVDERRQTGSFVIETRMRGTVYVSFTCPRDNNAQVGGKKNHTRVIHPEGSLKPFRGHAVPIKPRLTQRGTEVTQWVQGQRHNRGSSGRTPKLTLILEMDVELLFYGGKTENAYMSCCFLKITHAAVLSMMSS